MAAEPAERARSTRMRAWYATRLVAACIVAVAALTLGLMPFVGPRAGPPSLGGSTSPSTTPGGSLSTSPNKTASSSDATSLVPIATLDDWVKGWSPDGTLLLSMNGYEFSGPANEVHLRDRSGALVAKFAAGEAAWFDSGTLAVLDVVNQDTGESRVRLVKPDGSTIRTLPGTFTGGFYGTMLRASGNGRVAIANEPGGDFAKWTFRVWDGQNMSAAYSGLPIGWSPDGSRLAIVHPSLRSGCCGGLRLAGPLEVRAFPGLALIGSYPKITAETNDSSYMGSASFSPDNRYVYLDDSDIVAGTVVDLSRDASWAVGYDATWLPDSTLLSTASGVTSLWRAGIVSPYSLLGSVSSVHANRAGIIAAVEGGQPRIELLAAGIRRDFVLNGYVSVSGIRLSSDGETAFVSADTETQIEIMVMVDLH